MAAATADRNTQLKYLRDVQAYPMATNVKIFAGTIVALNATGWAAPAADTANFKVVGIAMEQVDNAGGANGAKKVQVAKCVAKLANAAAGDAVTQAHVGTDADVLDDQTVAQAGGAATANIPIGPIREVETDGVWVEVGL